MPLSFTAFAPLEALPACDQCQSSRVSTFLTSSHCKLRPNAEGEYLKSSCPSFVHTDPTAHNTFYFKDEDIPPELSGYYAFAGWDCNYGDIRKVVCPDPTNIPHCKRFVESQCDVTSNCIGFNFPGEILKKNCDQFESAAGSTVYIKHADIPPTVPRSSCVDGFCSTRVSDGTFVGATCDSACPLKPVPALASELAAFADAWNNETWTEAKLPSTPVGDPVAMAKAMLAKYPGL